MTLPSIALPKFELELPSTKEKITFRPFLVKEEKLLLIAQESGEEKDVVDAVKEIIKNCVLSGKIEIDNMPSFDIEYLFLNIRAKSIGEVVELKYRHIDGKNKAGIECDHVQDIEINLEEINVEIPENHERKIELENGIGMVLKYPTFEIIEKTSKIKSEAERTFAIMLGCVEQVWENDGETVHDDFSNDELNVFFENLTKNQFEKISQFFDTMPKLCHEIKYNCDECGEEETVMLEGLQNFFT